MCPPSPGCEYANLFSPGAGLVLCAWSSPTIQGQGSYLHPRVWDEVIRTLTPGLMNGWVCLFLEPAQFPCTPRPLPAGPSYSVAVKPHPRPCAPSLLPLTLRHHLSCVPLLSGRVNLHILPAHSENLFKSSAPPLPRPLDPRNRSDSLSFLTLEVCDGWSVSTQHQ